MDVIIVNNVSKTFRIYQEKNQTLKERLIYAGRTKYAEFQALKDVSLTIQKGQTVGLVGKNGSGKSTLLKLMTKILYPTAGSIEIHGRVSSLLELGAGFHPDFTGRENIYMNASILGLTRKEIDHKLDDIIRFSELGDFIDQPVRSYSSGMYTRLAFSVAINVDPDILLIDEVLAVGDASFQQKCINRIREFKRSGKTIVFVSHDQGIMEKLCDTIYWLNNGVVVEQGDPRKVLNSYLAYVHQRDEERHFTEAAEQQQQEEAVKKEEDEQTDAVQRTGSREVEIDEVKIVDNYGNERYLIQTEQEVQIQIKYHMRKRPESLVFGIGIFTMDGLSCYGTNTYIDRFDTKSLPESGTLTFRVPEWMLLTGMYTLDVAAHSEDGVPFDFQRGIKTFEVRSLIQDVGITRLHHEWKLEQ